ncbi:telomere-binding alpha subunit central domain protein [Aspergillus affinis]|uniref:telomere-binding alpha subunit central domain protein n=1 Tax=Aspergillus affinis TaxID=1070780 RepID=UPI0022FE0A57|nr:uncharacterized protein KD926_009248 [Aspergillus affinis]KAI9039655.1 hypothetical protein KD926_009248 [Aspergillus affinis]
MSEASRYPELVDIPTAMSKQGNVTVLGVVVDAMAPMRSRGTSIFITFTLKDSNLDNGHTWDGLKIKYFRDNESQLPPVRKGDVLLLRNVWVRTLAGKPLGVAAQDRTIPWALFRHESNPMSTATPICGPTPFEPSFTEKRLARSLLEDSLKLKEFRIYSVKPVAPQSHSATPASKSNHSAPDRFTLVRDAKYNAKYKTYVDIIGEVVKIYPTSRGDHVLMYITDYTTNRNLPDHGSDDEKGQEGDDYNYQRYNQKRWKGPSGQLSLAVTIWEPYDSYVREHVNEEDLVYLSNVEIKRGSHSTTMEAAIHGDKWQSNRDKVRLIDPKSDARARELLHRREEYWSRNQSKRKLAQDDEPPPQSKQAKRLQKRKAEAKKDASQTSIASRTRDPFNSSIIAAYSSCTYLPIEDILTNESHNNVSPHQIQYRFPFQNLCYRSIVRVVDFFPHKLEDFAVPERQDDGLLARQEREYATGDAFNRWEWRFCLLIESSSAPPPGQAREQMKLFVSDVEAVHLLNLDASDLRKNPDDLARLREKLFILWGNLEEQKREATEQNGQAPKCISSLPFACCIQEYGVKCSHRVAVSADDGSNGDEVGSSCNHDGCFGWERRFGMFKTRIN